MGMLVDGRWTDEDTIIFEGVYKRAASTIRADDIEMSANLIAETPERYLLVGSRSCPWSHRTLLMRGLKGLELPVHYAFGLRVQGYSLNGGAGWNIPGTDIFVRHLHEFYTLNDPSFTGRVTVPLLWDLSTQRIISNESTDILMILDRVPLSKGGDFTLNPASLTSEIETANQAMYQGLNNAVYRAGFAETQSVYDAAVTTVFETLDALELRLATSRYYFGDAFTETDLRIFPTLVRFDAIYAILFKCCLRRLVDYPNVWAYARDVYSMRGVSETVDFGQMRSASYLADSRDPHPIIAILPDSNWNEPHSRADIGESRIVSRSEKNFSVDPSNTRSISEST